jgi:hemoglobin/transferrin/lactoferrin receptor protein
MNPRRTFAKLTPIGLPCLLLAQDPTLPQSSTPNSPPTQPAAEEPADDPRRPLRPTPPQSTGPVLVTATRDARDPFLLPYATEVVDTQRMRERGYRTTPQALRDLPSILVQETSPGQGSPYLRGFTGYSNLFLIDGIRLNNSTFRSGPNQYWNTVDPLGLDRLEVVLGPAAALYGSDAVGGTVQAITRSPYRYAADGVAYGGSTYVRHATAERSVMGRGELSVGQTWADGTRTGFLLGGSAKSFGDLEAGRGMGTQPNTGYEERSFDVKVEHWLGKDERLVFLHQHLAQDDVPRTHSTDQARSYRGTAVGTDRRRDLDQGRTLTYLQYHKSGMGGFVDGVHASLSWHQQGEEQDRVRSNGAEDWQGFSVGSLGAFVQFDSSLTPLGRWNWGLEFYRDQVDSWLRRSTPQAADRIQGPVADNAYYDLFGVYLQDSIPIGESTELILGGRWTYAAANADKVRDPVTTNQISLEEDWSRFTGNVRLRHDLVARRWNVYGGVSQGFRAPSLSDLSSFETARSGEFEIAAPGLGAEKYLSYELGTKVQTDAWTARAAWFYTDMDDLVQRFPTGNVNGSGQREVTKANIGSGSVQGVEATLGWMFVTDTTLFAAGSWQYGRVLNYETAGTELRYEPMSRVMPLMYRAGVRYEPFRRGFWIETEIVHADAQTRLSSGDKRDTQRIPPGGSAAYTLWNLRCGWQIREQASLDVALENLTDYDYRVLGSGTNSPGRSLVLGLSVSF